MDYFVYILRCGDGSLYTGITNRLPQRFAQHQAGVGAKYTRGRGPLTLLYGVEVGNRSVASKEEARIKKLTKEQKFALIAREIPPNLEEIQEQLRKEAQQAKERKKQEKAEKERPTPCPMPSYPEKKRGSMGKRVEPKGGKGRKTGTKGKIFRKKREKNTP